MFLSITGIVISSLLLFYNHPFIERGGINPHSYAIKLFKKADSSSEVIARLTSGQFVKYKFSGATRKWHYVSYYGNELSVYHKNLELGYLRIFSVVLPKQIVVIAGVSSCLLFFIAFFTGKRGNRIQNQNVNQLTTSEEKKYSQSELDEAIRQEANKRELLQEQRTKDILNEFKAKITFEFEKERKATVDEMRASHAELQSLYDKAVRDAKVFDVDLKDVNFESLLKGRLFEICIAEMLTKVSNFKLLEWTPDKGFGKKIFVASNLNPDFVVANSEGKKFSIECKYRGMFRKINRMSEAVSWSKVKQSDRYLQFSKDRNIPVWVALGIGGDAASPHLISIAPLKEITASSENAFDDKVCSRQFLQQWEIEKGGGFEQNYFIAEN